MRKLLFLLSLTFLVITIHSCEQYTIVAAGDYDSFSGDIQAIFTNKCSNASCHGGGSPAAGLDLTEGASYAEIIASNLVNTEDPESSELYTKLTSGSHSSFANATEKAQILKWIQDGAPEN